MKCPFKKNIEIKIVYLKRIKRKTEKNGTKDFKTSFRKHEFTSILLIHVNKRQIIFHLEKKALKLKKIQSYKESFLKNG